MRVKIVERTSHKSLSAYPRTYGVGAHCARLGSWGGAFRMRQPSLRDEGRSPDTSPGRPPDQRSTNEGPGCGDKHGRSGPSAISGHRVGTPMLLISEGESLGRRRREGSGVG